VPFCPRCRNEYEATVPRCVDCGVDLVEDRPPDPRQVALREGARPVPLLLEDPETRSEIQRALAAAQVPAVLREDSEPPGALWIPAAYSAMAQRVVSGAIPGHSLEFTEEGGVLRREEPDDRDRIEDDAVLRMSLGEIASRGEEAGSALDRCLRQGTPPVLIRAGLLLRRIGDAGLSRLARALRESIERGDRERGAALLRELADGAERRRSPWPPAVLELGTLLREQDPARRAWGATVAGRLRLRQVYAKLVDLLMDPDPTVAVGADEALIEITDEDLGFDPGLERSEIERIVEERKEWARGRGI